MQLDKIRIIIFVIFITVIIAIINFLITSFPWFFIGIGSRLAPNPQKPEITYHEFPFKLTYELNGEIKVIEDVVICEYDGIKSLGEAGKYRKWKSHLKSGNERVSLLKVGDSLEFYFNYGDPENYMGDPQSGKYNKDLYYDLSYIPFIKKENGKQVADSGMLADKAWKEYRLRIIEWKYTSPIQNSFK